MAGKMNARRDYLAHQILVAMNTGKPCNAMDPTRDPVQEARWCASWAFAQATELVKLTDRDMRATGVHHVTCASVTGFDSSIPCSCHK